MLIRPEFCKINLVNLFTLVKANFILFLFTQKVLNDLFVDITLP